MDANELVRRIEGTFDELMVASPDLYSRISAWVYQYRNPQVPVVKVPRPVRVRMSIGDD